MIFPLHHVPLVAAIHPLATINALLNATATVLLVLGFILIKRRRVVAHRRTMLTALAVSAIFLVCYLAYHVWPVGARATPFQGEGSARIAYYTVLISHIVLATTVPVLAIWTAYLGLCDRREKHRQVARWTFPIWLYVSVTGVLIYWMLYYAYPQP